MGNRNIQYLDKVVDFLVEDSNILYDSHTLMLHTPFIKTPWTNFSRFSSTPLIYFVEYIENTYGVTRSESKYVWNKYVSKLKDKRYNQTTMPITESVEGNTKWFMNNPYDLLKFEGVGEELNNKLIKIVENTVDSIVDSITYEQLEDRSDLYVIKINDFNQVYGLYIDNDGTKKSFIKFCETYINYVLKEMMEIFRDYANRNPMLISNFGLGSTVLLLNKMGEIFINE